ncbi:MAG: hypothetical protein RL290_1071 [Actinomycetota bacterium]
MLAAMHTQLYIDGQWVEGASKVAVHDPSDNSVIAEVSLASDAQCEAAIAAAMPQPNHGQKLLPDIALRFCAKPLKL